VAVEGHPADSCAAAALHWSSYVVAAARPRQASCCLASVTDVADDADTDLVLHQLCRPALLPVTCDTQTPH